MFSEGLGIEDYSTYSQPIIPSRRSIVPLNFLRSDIITPNVPAEMEVGRHRTWELSVQLGSAGLGYCGIERAITITAYRARQGMGVIEQE